MASSVNSKPKYDVFVSCSGEDTCRNFTSNLHSALTRENIAALISDDGRAQDREYGMLSVLFKAFRAIGLYWNKEDRESNLSAHFKAIENSKISVIIFSRDYASSEWCLQELEKVLECRKSKGQIVVPVFYNIHPFTLQGQIEFSSYYFEQHEQSYKDTPERAHRWKAAVTEAANLYECYGVAERNDSELIKNIVSCILDKLPPSARYKTVSWELIFSSLGFFLEVPSAVFDQLSSPKRPQYTLYAMLISWSAMIFIIIDLVLKARKAKVYWDIRKFWLYYPPQRRRNPQPYFGIFKDNVGLLCGLCQCIATTINYASAHKPIRISVWPITFAFCVFFSQIIENLWINANVRKRNE